MATAERTLTRVAKIDLADAMKRLVPVSQRKSSIPILECVRMHADSAGLRLTTTDLDVAISVDVPADAQAPWQACVHAKELSRFVEYCGDTIDLESQDDRVSVASGRAVAAMPSLQAADFPAIAWPRAATFTLPAGVFRAALVNAIRCTTTENTRYFLDGYQVSIKNGRATVAATDGHRLAVCEFDAPKVPDVAFILTKRTVTPLVAMLEGLASVDVALGDTHLGFTDGRWQVISRVISATFPDTDRVIPKTNNNRVTVNRAAFEQAVRRISVFANPRSRCIVLSIEGGELAFKNNTLDRGAVSDVVPAKTSGEPLTLALNADYLIDFIDSIDTDEFEMNLKDEMAQITLAPVGPQGYGYLLVLMPMRI